MFLRMMEERMRIRVIFMRTPSGERQAGCAVKLPKRAGSSLRGIGPESPIAGFGAESGTFFYQVKA
jgi:hypothetical protein